MAVLRVIDRGEREAFADTLRFQEQLVAAAQADPRRPDCLVFVEHEPVYTMGRGKPLPPPVNGVPFVEARRGGQATYHGPGQLVAYAIFDLRRHGQDLRAFVRGLEESLIRTLGTFGIAAARRDGLTGVWITGPGGERKIASLGVGVERWVTFHGLALNVDVDLRAVRAINPCGLDGQLYVNLADVCREQGRPVPTVHELKRALAEQVAAMFGLRREAVGRPDGDASAGRRLPEWLRVPAPGTTAYEHTRSVLRDLKLVTVCEEARCPNHGECWSQRTATFMIMGDLCTRRCGFCSVKDGTLDTLQPLASDEPERVARAVQALGLRHVVVTSVNRDDLPDMGAAHFDRTVRAIARANPGCHIELLTPDMRGRRELVETILASGLVSVFNHNLETVPALYPTVRPGAKVERSLDVLRWAKQVQPGVRTKSGLMLGLGERRPDVYEVMDRLRDADCDVLTLGQYLRPSPQQLPVVRFVTPDEFAEYKVAGQQRGFKHVESGPLVRSSYYAADHTDGPTVRPAAGPEPLLQLGLLARRSH